MIETNLGNRCEAKDFPKKPFKSIAPGLKQSSTQPTSADSYEPRFCGKRTLLKGMEVLTAQLHEQASQIQKVSAQLELSKPAPRTVVNNR